MEFPDELWGNIKEFTFDWKKIHKIKMKKSFYFHNSYVLGEKMANANWGSRIFKKNMPKIGRSNKVKSFLFFLYVSCALVHNYHYLDIFSFHIFFVIATIQIYLHCKCKQCLNDLVFSQQICD